jgi:integrase
VASIVPRVTKRGTTAYQVRWREDGQQRSTVARGATDAARHREAKRLKAVIEANGRLPTKTGPDPQAPTFAAFTEHHLAHLTGVSGITRDVVRSWVLDRQHHVSGKTLKNLHGLLHGILAGAVEAGYLPANPARGVRLPRADDHERRDMAFLTQDEFWRVIDELPEHWRPYFILLAGTGLRLGELMALTVGDVDLVSRPPVVRITKAQRYTAGKGFEVGPTKTRRSRRTISLDETAIDALRPRLSRRADEPLVVQPNGRPMYPTNLYARIWRPAVDRARAKGLTKNPRIHDLRHTHASWLIAQGLPLPVIQSRLGHEQISTTIDRYGHLLPDLHVQAALATTRALERPTALPAPDAGG